MYHTPVLLHPSVDGLNIKPNGCYVDVTFGGGGHAREILSRLDGGKLYAFDQDADAEKNIPNDNRLVLIHHNFRFITNFLSYYGISKVDGILADLGVSSHQFDEAERGFSFRANAQLDMRMNQHAKLSASDIVNTYTEAALSAMFHFYGEIPNARKLANIIVAGRSESPIQTTGQLAHTIEKCTPKHKENKYLAQVFQALRIEVNHELDVLKMFLGQTASIVAPGGRLVVITYHSLEDRLVKNYIKSGNTEGTLDKDFFGNVSAPFKAVNRNVIEASEAELEQNSRARSAKLRIAEKV